MSQLQSVVSFFDNIAEAQQAIQDLLANGFTSETVHLSTRTDPTMAVDEPSATATADDSSGRFLSSLFGNPDEIWTQHETQVTVQTQSDTETRQVADLLNGAGAGGTTTSG